MNYPAVDFRKPVRVPEDVGRMLTQWLQSAREAFEIRMGRCSTTSVKISLESPEPMTGEELRQQSDTSLIYRVDVGEQGQSSLFLADRPLVLAMVMETLGAALEEFPEDRSLTDIEQATADFLLQELRNCLDASQPLVSKRSLKFQGLADLKELHAEFPANVSNAAATYRVDYSCGGGRLRWIIPQNLSLDMVADFDTGFQSNGQSTEYLRRSLLNSPAELSVRLGDCRLPLARLRNLKPGDVIVLAQRLDEPLQAVLGGQTLFSGWSARSGKHQVFQIDELTMPDSTDA